MRMHSIISIEICRIYRLPEQVGDFVGFMRARVVLPVLGAISMQRSWLRAW
jgi:hypothetical protein